MRRTKKKTQIQSPQHTLEVVGEAGSKQETKTSPSLLESVRGVVTRRCTCPSLSLYPQVPDFALLPKDFGNDDKKTGTAATRGMRIGAAVRQYERSFKRVVPKGEICGVRLCVRSPFLLPRAPLMSVAVYFLPLSIPFWFSYSRSGFLDHGDA